LRKFGKNLLNKGYCGGSISVQVIEKRAGQKIREVYFCADRYKRDSMSIELSEEKDVFVIFRPLERMIPNSVWYGASRKDYFLATEKPEKMV